MWQTSLALMIFTVLLRQIPQRGKELLAAYEVRSKTALGGLASESRVNIKAVYRGFF